MLLLLEVFFALYFFIVFLFDLILISVLLCVFFFSFSSHVFVSVHALLFTFISPRLLVVALCCDSCRAQV